MTDRYYLYTTEQIKQILDNNSVHNLIVFKTLIRNINVRKLLKQSIEEMEKQVSEYKNTVSNKQVLLEELTHNVNRLEVIKLLSNYYNTHTLENAEDYIVLDAELNHLCKRDKVILLGYCTCKYSIKELMLLSNHKEMSAEQITNKINALLNYITNSIAEGEMHE